MELAEFYIDRAVELDELPDYRPWKKLIYGGNWKFKNIKNFIKNGGMRADAFIFFYGSFYADYVLIYQKEVEIESFEENNS